MTKLGDALGKAVDFEAASLHFEAIELLYRALHNHAKLNPDESYLKIGEKYTQLCIDTSLIHDLREGIHTFKTACLQKGALDLLQRFFASVVTFVLDGSKECINALGKERIADKLVESDMTRLAGIVESLEASEVAADLLSEEKWLAKVEFYWEVLKLLLDMTRNHNKLLDIYQQVIEGIVTYIALFDRERKLRRLSDILHAHFVTFTKYSTSAAHSLHLNLEHTLVTLLHVRLEVAHECAQRRLWGESERQLFDISHLMSFARTSPPYQLQVRFYQLLSDVLLAAGSIFFHTYALRKCMQLQGDVSGILHNQVLLSALAIPFYATLPAQAASLCGYDGRVTASKLVQEISAGRDCTHPDIVALQALLEEPRDPFALVAQSQAIVMKIQSDPRYAPYVPHVMHAVAARVVRRVSAVYEKLPLERLVKAFPGYTVPALVRLLLTLDRKGVVPVRIDMAVRIVKFYPQGEGAHEFAGQVHVLAGRVVGNDGKEMIKVKVSKEGDAAVAERLQEIRVGKEREMRLQALKRVLERRKRVEALEAQEAKMEKSSRELLEKQRENQRRREEKKAREEEAKRRAEEEVEMKKRIEQAKRELAYRASVSRKLDHLTRAIRETEQAKIGDVYEERVREAAASHERQVLMLEAAAKERFTKEVAERERYGESRPIIIGWVEEVSRERETKLDALMEAYNQRLEAYTERRRAELKVERIKREALAEREAERRREEEERERKEEEVRREQERRAERIKAEEMEKRKEKEEENSSWRRSKPGNSTTTRNRGGDRDRYERGGDRDRYERGGDRDRYERGGDRDRYERGGDRDRYERGGERRASTPKKEESEGSNWRSQRRPRGEGRKEEPTRKANDDGWNDVRKRRK